MLPVHAPGSDSWLLDGHGGAVRLHSAPDGPQGNAWDPATLGEKEVLWVDLDSGSASARTWLDEHSGLTGELVHPLLEEDPWPRVSNIKGQALFVTLRFPEVMVRPAGEGSGERGATGQDLRGQVGHRSGGADSGGVDPGGVDPGGADPRGADPGGADPGGADPGGADPRGADSGRADPASTAEPFAQPKDSLAWHAPLSVDSRGASVRLWLEPSRVLSVGASRIVDWEQVQERFDQRKGPRDPADVFLLCLDSFLSHLHEALTQLRAIQIDFDLLAESQTPPPMDRLRGLRRGALVWRRYAEPIRDLLIRLKEMKLPWLDTEHHKWSGVIDLLDEVAKELASVVDHSRALHDYLESRSDEQLNARLYVLTVVNTVLMPVTVVIGALGISVGPELGWHGPGWAAFSVLVLVLTGWGGYFLIQKKLS